MGAETERCRLCGQNTRAGRGNRDTEQLFFDCPRCGEFSMTASFYETGPSKEEHSWLCNATRQAYEAGRPLTLHTGNYQRYIEEHRSTGLQENIEKLLNYVYQKCPRPGMVVTVEQHNDYTVVDAKDRSELLFI